MTGRVVDLGWPGLSHFHRGVVFCNPVFDVKLSGSNDNLFCLCVGRKIGESVVDGISLPSTRLKIVRVLVRGFPLTPVSCSPKHSLVPDLAYDPILRTGCRPIRRLEGSVVRAWKLALVQAARR